MKAKKILFITQAMVPFVPEDEKSIMGRYLPQSIQELGHEIRTFTPKWGIINERRNQLHEVIRLSGMNIIIDDTDHPLIIKVASIPQARMQIYFIDNDDYFTKRQMIFDEDGKEYEDNGERAIFFARGVLETVKKLRWVPDVVHCHGWVTALAPLFIKKAYADEPSFAETKVVFSASSPEFSNDLGELTRNCIPFRDAKLSDVVDVCSEKFGYDELQKIAIKFSDGVVLDDEKVNTDVVDYAKSLGLPVLPYQGEDYKDAYHEFYEQVMGGEE
jgi:starch synthase